MTSGSSSGKMAEGSSLCLGDIQEGEVNLSDRHSASVEEQRCSLYGSSLGAVTKAKPNLTEYKVVKFAQAEGAEKLYKFLTDVVEDEYGIELCSPYFSYASSLYISQEDQIREVERLRKYSGRIYKRDLTRDFIREIVRAYQQSRFRSSLYLQFNALITVNKAIKEFPTMCSIDIYKGGFYGDKIDSIGIDRRQVNTYLKQGFRVELSEAHPSREVNRELSPLRDKLFEVGLCWSGVSCMGYWPLCLDDPDVTVDE